MVLKGSLSSGRIPSSRHSIVSDDAKKRLLEEGRDTAFQVLEKEKMQMKAKVSNYLSACPVIWVGGCY